MNYNYFMIGSTKQGWVRLHRKIEDNFLWFSESFTKAQAWIDLFLNANHKDGNVIIRGNIIKLKRGQIGWSELTMSKRWQWSKCKVRRFLKLLETEQQIIQQKDRFITTIITIIQYDKYQNDIKTIQQTIQRKDSRRYINKNDKNDKNDMLATSPKSPHQEIIDFYYEAYKQQEGVSYVVSGGDGKAVKEALTTKQMSPQEVKSVLRWYLQRPDFKKFPTMKTALSGHFINIYRQEELEE